MARYAASVVSSAALTATGFFWLTAGSTGDLLIRRLTLSFAFNSATVPTSQQAQVSAQPGTGLAASASTITSRLLRSTSRPALAVAGSAAGTGTFTAVGSPFLISLNTQSAGDLPWEQLEEWQMPASSTLVVANVGNTLPAGCQIVLSVEWEE